MDLKFSNIYVGTGSSPVGDCFVAWVTDNDATPLICFLAFIEDLISLENAKSELSELLPASFFTENNQEAKNLIAMIFDKEFNDQIKLLIKGTQFQQQVWHALTEVNFGRVASYQELAELIGNKDLTRAVASALAKNNISYLIPCHRIIRKSGDINEYRWGKSIKKKLLDWEKSKLPNKKDFQRKITIIKIPN